MALARMNDEQPEAARRFEHFPARHYRLLQARHVVAERRAEAAGFQKIPLHVDDHERGVLEIDG